MRCNPGTPAESGHRARIAGAARVALATVLATIVLAATACSEGREWGKEADAEHQDRPAAEVSEPVASVTDPADDRGDGLVDPKDAMYELAPNELAPNEPAPGSAPAGADEGGTYLVGDSTMVEAAAASGLGSAYSGHGFTDEAVMGLQNPLDLPPANYDGMVVLGVSLWDSRSADLSGYREATDRYRDLGYDVVWIEVPPAGVHYDGGPLNPELEALNEAVADHLGCALQPWSLRDVETLGSAGVPDKDWTHPTPSGGLQISHNAEGLTGADACVPTTA